MRSRIAAFLLPAILASFPAAAQPARSEVSEIAAKAEKDANARRFDAAVAGYRKAWDLSHDPAYLYNLGVLSLMGLKDATAAYGYATRFVAVARNAQEKSEADALLKQVEAALAATHGKLVVAAVPADATVHVDNGSEPMGSVETWILPGLHVLRATAPGHEPGEIQVTVTRGLRNNVSIVLRTLPAVLKVECATPGISIRVDDRTTGEREIRVGPGNHEVRVDAAGFSGFVQKVTVGPGETRVIHADLAPKPADVPVAPPSRPVIRKPDRTWAWVAIGSGCGLAVTGAVLYGLAYRDYKAASDLDPADYGTDPAKAEPAYATAFDSRTGAGRKKAIVAYVLWGAGAAALGTGLYLYFTADPGLGAVVVPAGPGGPGITATVSF